MSGSNLSHVLLNPSQFGGPSAPSMSPYNVQNSKGKSIGTMNPYIPNQYLINQLYRLNNANPYQRLGIGYSFNPVPYVAPVEPKPAEPAPATQPDLGNFTA